MRWRDISIIIKTDECDGKWLGTISTKSFPIILNQHINSRNMKEAASFSDPPCTKPQILCSFRSPASLQVNWGGESLQDNTKRAKLSLNDFIACVLHPAFQQWGSQACSLTKRTSWEQERTRLWHFCWCENRWFTAPLSLLLRSHERDCLTLSECYLNTSNEEGKMFVYLAQLFFPTVYEHGPKYACGLCRYFTEILSSIHRCKNPRSTHTNAVRYV